MAFVFAKFIHWCMCLMLVGLTAGDIPLPAKPINQREKDTSYWNDLAKAELKLVLESKNIEGVAKNVILFLGDGMGLSTVTASRVLKGQLSGGMGEDAALSFDAFPHTGLSRTYSVDHTTTDSAASGTAYLCGVKTNTGLLGVNAKVTYGNCSSMNGGANNVTSILRWSIDAGKVAGVVTTTRVTHATPAATYSHTAHRDWEGDIDLFNDNVTGCTDIAHQLVHDNGDIDVVMGGGRFYFFPENYTDPEYNKTYATYKKGRRDGQNLVNLWLEKKRLAGKKHQYVWNLSDFNKVDPATTDSLMGLFEPDHMKYDLDRPNDVGQEPSLAQMTEKAIRILQRNPKGFFLLVEGGKIDHGHHESKATMALHDTVAFSDAIQRAVNLTSASDTLIVVTADHSHTFVLAGYPTRGNPILGAENDNEKGKDGKPYTSLLYGNGPGYQLENGSRPDISQVNTSGNNYIQQSAVPLSSETHGGEDVGIYAMGPMAHLYAGVHQQNYIPHVMAYASCVGQYKDDPRCTGHVTSAASIAGGSYLCLIVAMHFIVKLLHGQ